jgi:hypothetical protein
MDLKDRLDLLDSCDVDSLYLLNDLLDLDDFLLEDIFRFDIVKGSSPLSFRSLPYLFLDLEVIILVILGSVF